MLINQFDFSVSTHEEGYEGYVLSRFYVVRGQFIKMACWQRLRCCASETIPRCVGVAKDHVPKNVKRRTTVFGLIWREVEHGCSRYVRLGRTGQSDRRQTVKITDNDVWAWGLILSEFCSVETRGACLRDACLTCNGARLIQGDDTTDLEVNGTRGRPIIYQGVMLKVSWSLAEESTRLMERLLRKSTKSRSLFHRDARGTLFGLELRVREMRGTRHRSGMTDGYLQWGLRWCGLATWWILAKIADARRGDSGEACGKHGKQQQTRAQMVRQLVWHVCRGAEAVLASIRFKLVTRSIGIDVKWWWLKGESVDETTVNLTQGDSRATMNSFKLYNFHVDLWSVFDSVEYEEGTIATGRVMWRLGKPCLKSSDWDGLKLD
jgi:hypothetical protein